MKKWDKRRILDARLARKTGNPDKLKSICILHLVVRQTWWGTDYSYWSNDELGYARVPRTRNEQRQNCGHCDEYGEWMVRGRRRGYNLPDSWSDRPCSINRRLHSWKAHSKRERQYK